MNVFRRLIVLLPVVVVAFAGCATTALEGEEEGEATAPLTGQCAGVSAGACSGKAIDAAVRCAVAKGAKVLSYYRSPAQQECVRRQNHCTDRCTGSAGCDRPTAGCTTSPHSRCHAVDLVKDGAPLTRAQLRTCGLAKTTAPHANHYDLLDGVVPPATPAKPKPPAGADPDDGDEETPIPTPPPRPAGLSENCKSFTLGRDVPPGTCVQRADDSNWYVCDGSSPTTWPAVADELDAECKSCPQLSGGRCP